MLTDKACKSANCPIDKARARFSDAGGLYLEVSPAGSKRWFLKYRKEGKEMRLALGSYPNVSLAEVRLKQSEAKALKHKGIDPVHDKKVGKLKASRQAIDNLEAIARPSDIAPPVSSSRSYRLACFSITHATTSITRSKVYVGWSARYLPKAAGLKKWSSTEFARSSPICSSLVFIVRLSTRLYHKGLTLGQPPICPPTGQLTS